MTLTLKKSSLAEKYLKKTEGRPFDVSINQWLEENSEGTLKLSTFVKPESRSPEINKFFIVVKSSNTAFDSVGNTAADEFGHYLIKKKSASIFFYLYCKFARHV